MTLEETLASLHEEAAILAKYGDATKAAAISEIVQVVKAADGMAEYLNWLTEGEAMSRSGRTKEWLRARFGGWADQYLARMHPHQRNVRQYRACIVPQRPNRDAARDLARREAAA